MPKIMRSASILGAFPEPMNKRGKFGKNGQRSPRAVEGGRIYRQANIIPLASLRLLGRVGPIFASTGTILAL